MVKDTILIIKIAWDFAHQWDNKYLGYAKRNASR